MKSVKITDSLHDKIKKYSIFNNVKLEDFVISELEKSRKLQDFVKNLKTMRL